MPGCLACSAFVLLLHAQWSITCIDLLLSVIWIDHSSWQQHEKRTITLHNRLRSTRMLVEVKVFGHGWVIHLKILVTMERHCVLKHACVNLCASVQPFYSNLHLLIIIPLIRLLAFTTQFYTWITLYNYIYMLCIYRVPCAARHRGVGGRPAQ